MDGYWWEIIHNERLQDYPRGTIGAPKTITSKTQGQGNPRMRYTGALPWKRNSNMIPD